MNIKKYSKAIAVLVAGVVVQILLHNFNIELTAEQQAALVTIITLAVVTVAPKNKE